MTGEHPQKETPAAEIIDVSGFVSAAHPEYVTPGEKEILFRQASHLLEVDGVDSHINGVPARVTRHYALTAGNGQQYFARVSKYLPTGKQEKASLPMVVLDENQDIEVQSPDAYMLKFVTFGSLLSLQADSDPVNPRVDDRNDLAIAQRIIGDISKAYSEDNEAVERRRQVELESRRVQRRMLAREVRSASWRVGAGLAVIGAIGGIIFGVTKAIENYKDDQQAFDDHHYSLAGGQTLTVGQTAAPAYSTELFDNAKLDMSGIPHVTHYGDANKYGDDYFGISAIGAMGKTGILREVIISSSKPKRNCETFDINNMELGTTMKAWTDFTAPDGTSRANELTMQYTLTSATACWNGQERNNNDDPRVVFELLAPKK